MSIAGIVTGLGSVRAIVTGGYHSGAAGSATGATAAEIWAYEITPGVSAGDMLLDIWRRLGLDPGNPLAQTSTQIVAGTVLDLALAESAGTVTVTRQ